MMIDMKRYFAGLDLGTSSVKLLLVGEDGNRIKVRKAYPEISEAGWFSAIREAVSALGISPEQIMAIGLSSQVGTYLTDTGSCIGWNEAVGGEELRELKSAISQEVFIRELDMAHPDIISYPLPRMLHIRRTDPVCREVLMPKERLIRTLTGKTVTDVFSQRGIAHTGKGCYSQALLKQLKLSYPLPPIGQPTDLAGLVTPEGERDLGFAAGTPVYLGCNDFFAGLLGMGVLDTGTLFELSGTSAHIGMISENRWDGMLVSGRYFENYVTYGGTKASGASAIFAMRTFGIEGAALSLLEKDPPLFLPYLTGERAPIYDEKARGVFFGIGTETDRAAMAYAVLEGVVFSLFHIAQALPAGERTRLITAGGVSDNPLVARLKAELFDCPILGVEENDASALGAAMLAMVGAGYYSNLREALDHTVRYQTLAVPTGQYREQLLRRYEVYSGLYGHLKEDFAKFAEISQKGGQIK